MKDKERKERKDIMSTTKSSKGTTGKPNVIIMYADDLGYGDLGCYGGCEIPTPNIDRLCADGLKFTKAFAASAVCTPSRYSLMTGDYPFRNAETFILPGDAKCIIDEKKDTMAKVFKRAGYTTGVIGKWHMGLGDGDKPIDWNREISRTPLDVGFDTSFIFPATADRVPCVFVDGRKVVDLEENDPIEVTYSDQCPFDDIPTYKTHPEMLKMHSSHGHDMSIVNGVGRIGYMRGGEKALWKDEALAEIFSDKAKAFVRSSHHKNEPFFLYYALHQPHVPRLPAPQFVGATALGPRGDVIVEMDWCVGELVKELEHLGILENTMIIFSSDNGPVVDDGYIDRAVELNGPHCPAGPLRGGKYSKYDGGTRVPFIISQKGTVREGVSDALVGQVDLMASFSAMLNVPLAEASALDSENMLNAFLGGDPVGRAELMMEGASKGRLLHSGKWVYISPSEGLAYNRDTDTELGNSLDPQLYNTEYDIGQQKNVACFYPELVKNMEARLNAILQSKRTKLPCSIK